MSPNKEDARRQSDATRQEALEVVNLVWDFSYKALLGHCLGILVLILIRTDCSESRVTLDLHYYQRMTAHEPLLCTSSLHHTPMR